MNSHAGSLADQARADIAVYFAGKPAPTRELVGTPPPATQFCAGCHGFDGARPTAPQIPILAGQYRDYLLRALQDYKSGKRKNPTMAGIITGVEAKDFPAIARFYSRQQSLCSTDEGARAGAMRAALGPSSRGELMSSARVLRLHPEAGKLGTRLETGDCAVLGELTADELLFAVAHPATVGD